MKQVYAEVILPLALPGSFTYAIPSNWINPPPPGTRVVVEFGKRKLYTGLVRGFRDDAPRDFKIKPLLDVLDPKPLVTEAQLKFWDWLAEYYLCTPGEVMIAALPAALKMESETRLMLRGEADLEREDLEDDEYLVLEALTQENELSIAEISEITNRQNPLPALGRLLAEGLVVLKEELTGGYRPKVIRQVKLALDETQTDWEEVFERLKRAPRQRDLLLKMLSLPRTRPVAAARLLRESGAGDSALKALADKGIIEVFSGTLSKAQSSEEEEKAKLPELNAAQAKAWLEVQRSLSAKKPVLLHGITSSGKTALYIYLIAEQLAAAKEVLYLVPEIALTTQLITRLKKVFGERVLVYHSRYSNRERAETWLNLQKENKGQARLVLATRSGIFLPFRNLGAIIVDEEHEGSYKQQDPAPRYHARDAVLFFAAKQKVPVLLGSATPSFESYQNARNGKFALVELKQRYADLPLPDIVTVDLKRARKYREVQGAFSKQLFEQMEATLAQQKQIILFQNRRGFSTVLQCRSCGTVVQCKNCDVSLTYHQAEKQLKCHYCGYRRQRPARCPACQSPELFNFGIGTEKLEEDLQLRFPEARSQRLDLDSTRRKNAFSEIIEAFESGLTDILVGTQMVTKGLDFEGVSLVGIINADALLNFPDFRAHEKAFQLLSQVAGRAGRHGSRGEVLVQTAQPNHSVIAAVKENNYQGFFESELKQRAAFHYPPHFRLIKITTQHAKAPVLEEKTKALFRLWQRSFGGRLLGPEYPLIPRVRNRYRQEIMLKLEAGASLSRAKKLLKAGQLQFENSEPRPWPRIIYDVDPL